MSFYHGNRCTFVPNGQDKYSVHDMYALHCMVPLHIVGRVNSDVVEL